MKPISTVNFIEMKDDAIISLNAYPDTPEGNQEAEKRFRARYLENCHNKGSEDASFLDGCIEDGRYSNIWGYDLFIIHSNT